MRWQLFLEPSDVLLFRDGRPFAAGEDHLARSLFPPTPFTVQGAVRSKALVDSGISMADYVSDNPAEKVQKLRDKIGVPAKGYGQLRLLGPFVAQRNDDGTLTRYFPVPADVVDKGTGNYAIAVPLRGLAFSANYPDTLSPLWVRTDLPTKGARGWIAEPQFVKYLDGRIDFTVTRETELVHREPRLGISLDYELRRPTEGMLYQTKYLRLREGVGFLLEVDGLEPFKPPVGSLPLGGEARPAYYEVRQRPLTPLPRPDPLPARFKVVLLTPAWFSGGWRPRGGDWSKFFTGRVRLVAAAMHRAQALGGAYVDDKRRRDNFQKVMRRFVPAGSVFFFEAADEATYKEVPFTETPEDEGDFGQIGFGCVALAEWNYT